MQYQIQEGPAGAGRLLDLRCANRPEFLLHPGDPRSFSHIRRYLANYADIYACTILCAYQIVFDRTLTKKLHNSITENAVREYNNIFTFHNFCN